MTDEPTTKAHAFAVRLGDTLEVALREIGAMSDDELADLADPRMARYVATEHDAAPTSNDRSRAVSIQLLLHGHVPLKVQRAFNEMNVSMAVP